jgi:hypothetical protein
MEPTTVVAPTKSPLRDSYFTEAKLAKELPKCTVRKLRTWRRLRLGPKWLKIGREVVYLRESVEEWMRANELIVTREHRQSRRRGR